MKRNWSRDIVVVVPGRTSADGTETSATYFAGKRVDAADGSRKPVDMAEVPPVPLRKKPAKQGV